MFVNVSYFACSLVTVKVNDNLARGGGGDGRPQSPRATADFGVDRSIGVALSVAK